MLCFVCPPSAILLVACVRVCAGQVPVYAPTLVKALEGKGSALVRSGQHHTLVLTQEGAAAAAAQGHPTGCSKHALCRLCAPVSRCGMLCCTPRS